MLRFIIFLYYLVTQLTLIEQTMSLPMTLTSDPSCTCDIACDGCYALDCSYPSENNTNLADIIQEIAALNGQSYYVRIVNHYYPTLENISFNASSYKSITLDRNSIEFISDQVFKNLNECQYLSLESNAITQSFVINAPNLVSLTIKNNLLETIQKKMLDLPNAIYIDLTINKISFIEPDAFHNLKSLLYLELSKNQIQHLAGGLFKNLTKLDYLNLAMNFLEEIEPDYFVGLDNLTALELQNNFIKMINVDSLKPLSQLQRLCLDNLELTSLTSTAFNGLETLTDLQLNNNFFKTLNHESFDHLASLTTLSVNLNLMEDLCSLTRSIVNTLNVTTVDFSSNQITRIEAGCFKSFPRLEKLNLDKNEIYKIEIGAFHGIEGSLDKLFLSNNPIQDIKKHFFSGLAQLTELNLCRCQISTIEAGSFTTTLNLKSLDLSQNCLYKLDSSLFTKMTKLETLILTSNVLQRLDRLELFASLESLKELYLDNNKLYKIEGVISSTNRLVNLQKLMLDSNRLTEFSVAKYNQSFKKLETLGLHNNFITEFDSSNLKTLKELDLSKNPIERIAHDVFVSTLTSLNLSNTSTETVNYIIPFVSSDILDISYIDELDAQALSELFRGRMLKEFYMRNVKNVTSVSFLNNVLTLETLDLSNNPQLSIFKSSVISRLKNLSRLYLEGLSIQSIDQIGLSNLTNISTLNLNYNMIRELRKNNLINLANSLTALYLRSNNISYIEKGALSSIKYLIYLDLYQNNLFRMEPLYSQLDEIVLANNKLEALPSRLNFNKIIASNNRLTDIGNIVASDADSIILTNNFITEVKNNSFASLPLIQKLFLNSNFIRLIEPNSFKVLSNLETLDLGQNMIAELDSLTLAGLNGLMTLNLSHNHIEYLDQSIFLDLVNLEMLDISFNRLRMIKDRTFEPASILRSLFMSNNIYQTKLSTHIFHGLDFNYIEFDRVIMYDPLNIAILQNSLKPKKYPREVLEIRFYRSIDLVYIQFPPYTDFECKQILSFIKINLKLNLFDSNMADKFLKDCLFSIQ